MIISNHTIIKPLKFDVGAEGTALSYSLEEDSIELSFIEGETGSEFDRAFESVDLTFEVCESTGDAGVNSFSLGVLDSELLEVDFSLGTFFHLSGVSVAFHESLK